MFGPSRVQTIGLVSIGGDSVSAGVAVYQSGRAVLTASEQRVLPPEERSSEHAIVALKQKLTEALSALFDSRRTGMYGVVPRKLYCVIRAPWARGQIVRTHASSDEEQPISSAMIAALSRQVLSNAPNPDDVLEASVTQTMLNGYPTSHPDGKRAHDVRVSVLVSSCDPLMYKSATEAIATVFPSHRPIVFSGARAILESVLFARPSIRDFLAMDITEEGAAAVVVRHGGIEADAYLPEGVRSMLGRVSATSAAKNVRDALRMMAHDECSSATCAEIERGLAKMEPELVHIFGEFFATLSNPQRLPGTLVLITHPDLAPWLSVFFSRLDFTQFILTARPFEVVVLSASDLAPAESTVSSSFDIDLSLMLPLINKEQETA